MNFADGNDKDFRPPIEILIGTDYYYTIIKDKVIRLGENLKLTESKFGWILHGSRPGAKVKEVVSYNALVRTNPDEMLIRQFWDLETIGIKENEQKIESKQEGEILKTFEEEFTMRDNRVVVALPWNEKKEDMGTNEAIATKRFQSLQRKFHKEEDYKTRYVKAMEGYFKDDQVEEANTQEKGSYFLPHHAVIDDTRETTKTRIVFDGSSKEKGTRSLNSVIEKGPNLNPETLATILRFRTQKYVIAADGSKAFLQLILKEEDRKATKFLWYQTKKQGNKVKTNFEEVKVYQFARLPFGLTSSPFLLAATIRHIAKVKSDEFPGLKEIIEDGMYVDDFESGSENETKVEEEYKNVKALMGHISIPMQKWITNSPKLKEKWIEEKEFTRTSAKILGIGWDHDEDKLQLSAEPILQEIKGGVITKRALLRATAKVYDPVGLVAPLTLISKVLFQDTWKRGLGWNDFLPEDLAKRWRVWTKEIIRLEEIKIDRWVQTLESEDQRRELHIFCDASIKAYGAVVYVRTITGGKIDANLLVSKCRLAPVKKITLPRLELLATVISVRLAKYVTNEIRIGIETTTFWTDSMITLQWIKEEPSHWKPFVANRTSEIQESASPEQWRHCPGKENPADHLSRGLTVERLKDCKEWWKGPKWLSEKEETWPKVKSDVQQDEKEMVEKEKKKGTVTLTASVQENVIQVTKFSSQKKLLRVTAWIYRFYGNCKKKKEDRAKGELTATEIEESKKTWVKTVQKEAFGEEIQALKEDKMVKEKSKVWRFNPYLDAEEIMRIGGRLQFSELSLEEKHPVILDGKHEYVKLMIRNEHQRLHHMGTKVVLAELRQKFWILNARKEIKKEVKDCIICKKLRNNPGKLTEAPMPLDRLKLTRPFEVCGVDFAGPLYVKNGRSQEKRYVALFTCATTRAVHLELVEDMTAEKFILALRRFFARRGISSTIYSDNAKSFKRTDKELAKLFATKEKEVMDTFLAHRSVKWKYIAEKAAWWGGWWERCVQTVKRCLKKTIGKANIKHEELQTTLTEVEATINSRPLTFDYTEQEEESPLTPAHFLTGERLTQLSDMENGQEKIDEVGKMWKRRKQIMKAFETRWKKEYLQDLRSFHEVKIRKEGPKFENGDIVLIAEDMIPRQRWQMARIIETREGRDKKIRSCLVQKANGNKVLRPIQLLHPLELNLTMVQGEESVGNSVSRDQ